MSESRAGNLASALSIMGIGGAGVESGSATSMNKGTPTHESSVGSASDHEESTQGETLDHVEGSEEGLEAEKANPMPEETDESDASSPSEKEEVVLDGGRVIEIDYTNRAAIKQAHLDRHNFEKGMRKLQAERDQARQHLDKSTKEAAKVTENWNALESAFQETGVPGLLDLILKDQGGFSEFEKSLVARAKYRETASPDQLRMMDQQEAAEKFRRDLERERKANLDFKNSILAEKEAAEMKRNESVINPIFTKNTFTGKLGDADAEARFNEMLWTKATQRVAALPGNEVPEEEVSKIFSEEAAILMKVVGKQVNQGVKQAVANKKKAATESVQAQIKSGYGTQDAAAAETKNLMKKRNYTELVANWGKHSKFFS